MPAVLPEGNVTFLFTDIEGSTRLVHEHGDAYGALLAEHHRLLREVWATHNGVEVDTAGDAFFVAFAAAHDAVAAAAAAQPALAGTPFRVRIGVHTGEGRLGPTGYWGLDVHRAARIAAVASGGQVLLSETTRLQVDVGVRELGRHRLKDLTSPERLFQLGDEEFPPLRTLYATNLPVQPGPLIGREREVEELVGLVRAGERLVTLTGAGGSGKTRLAMHAAAEVADEFDDGVWFVSLSALTDPALVMATVSQTMGLAAAPIDELRAKRTLLVLDNFEQVIDAAGAVAELLAGTSELQLLVTSRERLAIRFEREYAVPPLQPDDGVSLFVERAHRVGAHVQDDEAVVEIVRRVDGLPLAIELAAARAKALPPSEILERLARSLDLLRAEARDVPERQRTIRATIEWSHDLLSAAERAAFARLGVFPGSFDLAAAESVAGADVDELAALVDKSLLRTTGAGRYFMLETVRAFAAERLLELPDVESLHQRLAGHVSALVRVVEPGLRDRRQRDVIELLGAELPNIRASLDTLRRYDDPGAEALLAADCAYFWYLTGQVEEGLARVRVSYDRLPDDDRAERGSAANALALLTFMSGDVPGALEFAREALRISRLNDDTTGILRALVGLSVTSDYVEARRIQQEQVRIAEGAGERWYLALGLVNLGVSERELGNLERAVELELQAVPLALELGDTLLAVGALCNAAHAERRAGDFASAADRFRDAMALLDGQSVVEGLIWTLDGLASVSVPLGDPERGAVLLGAAEALWNATSYDHPETRKELEQTRAGLAAALGRPRLEELCARGAALDASALSDYALARPTDAGGEPVRGAG